MSGLVTLVGAGPGDPELLTLKGARRLGEADLVLYDALVDRSVLNLAPRARRFFVGKRAGKPGIGQESINALMIRWGRKGRRVVRLKCGDPFVLGRGGEELHALVSAGIPVEVVPGVSAATAAPALAGISLTHRGAASAFVVVSGHDARAYGRLLDCLEPEAATVVILMGAGGRREIAARLIASGWPADTPAALVVGASTAGAALWCGDLSKLGDAAPVGVDGSLPVTIVVGRVVALRCAEAVAPPAQERGLRNVSAG